MKTTTWYCVSLWVLKCVESVGLVGSDVMSDIRMWRFEYRIRPNRACRTTLRGSIYITLVLKILL